MRLAVIGDIHGAWDEKDNAYFERENIDFLLFTGDLAAWVGTETFRLAEIIARLKKPFAMIAGNHDCVTLSALVGEFTQTDLVSRLQSGAIARRYQRLQSILGDRLVGYSTVELGPFTVVGARPFAMDGARLSFAGPLQKLFGIRSLTDSAERIGNLIGKAKSPVVVLAHNGPRGLGADRHDPFGIDFRKQGGDNGDADLAEAIARNKDKIALVVAGHMHHKVKGSRQPRTFAVVHQGTPVVNGARVPRHAGETGFYLALEWDGHSVGAAKEVWYNRETGKEFLSP
jgi:uncharacterized protein (TIGR04168 family)